MSESSAARESVRSAKRVVPRRWGRSILAPVLGCAGGWDWPRESGGRRGAGRAGLEKRESEGRFWCCADCVNG